MSKFFRTPFALNGDKTPIPDTVQGDGTVSYAQGYGLDYERDYDDPLAKDIPRAADNQIKFDITEAIGEIQQNGLASWSEDGKPYPIKALVYHNGTAFLSLKSVNNTTPAAGTDWRDISDALSPSDLLVSTGTSETQGMTQKAITDVLALKLNVDKVVQMLGSSTSDVVSQKKITDELAAANARILSLEDENTVARITWNMDTDTYSGTPRVTDVHRSMRRCLVDNTGTVNYYLNEFDSTKKENGIDPAVTNGTDGQVMVEIGVQAYVRTTILGSQVTWELTHLPLPGFELHPAFEGGAVEKIYIGAYDAVVWQASGATVIDGLNLDNNTSRVNLSNDRLYSTPGNFAMVGLTRNEFRTLARNGGFQLYEYWQWQLVQMLFITEYGNWNSQAVLGRGNVDGGTWPASSSNQGSSLNKINGLSDQFGNFSGSVATADGQPFVTYRGIENVWGNSWQFIDGVNANNRQLYVSTNEATFADDIGTGDYSALGSPLPTASDSSIKNWQPIDHAFVPKVVGAGATSSTFIGDSLWTATGWTTLHVGGHADSALSAGLSCCHANTAASHRSRAVSSRLSKKLRS